MQKEKRIRSITHLYYSNPKIQKALFDFSKDREVIPRYFEGFGKRPDTIQYPSDVLGLVSKGATSFHASEEIWNDPLKIDSDMSQKDLDSLRKSWDLLIDIDSPFLDYSKIAASLIIKELEKNGVKNYGLKFSGSKGFHIIVPAKAFPEFLNDLPTKEMFPEWPRAISEYLMYKIRQDYNKEVTKLDINFEALEVRTKLSKSDVTQTLCPNCGKESKKGAIVKYICPECNTTIERKNPKIQNRKLKCIQDSCPGNLQILEKKDFFFCENCQTTSHSSEHFSDKKVVYTKEAKKLSHSQGFEEQISGEKMASLDLVLVAPRHLFRMPYSLHEKTALASTVITKEEISDFSPKDANPLKIKVKNFYPEPENGEASALLESAVIWKKSQEREEEQKINEKYARKEFEKIDSSKVTEDMFPKSIKKLLKGLSEGRKRGLFVLLTFLRSLNFPPDYINKKIRDWNKLNDPPLKEGYVKSQIDWHLKQKKQILPPNYRNDNFYKDLKLIEEYPKAKNPLVEVTRKIYRSSN